MKTLAKYRGCNQCVIDKKTFKNILIGPAKLPGLFEKRTPGQKLLHFPLPTFLHLVCVTITFCGVTTLTVS